jgi:hypothetical protein
MTITMRIKKRTQIGNITLSSRRKGGYVSSMRLLRALLVSASSLLLLAPASRGQDDNTLTDAEKAAGWQLLFNGTNFDGWHNFHQTNVNPGWQVKSGALFCADPHQAGDIVTSNKFDWFELQLDYTIAHRGNSGILYHVTGEDQSGWPTWLTGPEFQLLDNVDGIDAEPRQMSGWLYGLYAPPLDPKTGKPLDATRPVGEWNHVRLLVVPPPQKCEHEINGVKYFDYVLHSDDFNARVAASKFGRPPLSQFGVFAKSDTGVICLQGDHGSIAFRNIKIRPIKP